MPTDNLIFWKRLETTPADATKAFDRGGFKGTAINANYVMRRLTELFGPCGVGWRFVIEQQKYVMGPTLENGINNDRSMVHIVLGHIAYALPGEIELKNKTGAQFGQTTMIGERNNGRIYFDEEAPKKSMTDAVGKCAATLGIGADIYSGKWDDNKYHDTPADDGQPTNGSDRKSRARKPKAAEPPVDDSSRPRENTGENTAFDPADASTWSLPDWQEYVGSLGEEETIAEFQSVRVSDLAKDMATWPAICEAFAEHARKLCKPNSPHRAAFVAAFQEEKARIAAASDNGSNETEKPKAAKAVRRTRAKKA